MRVAIQREQGEKLIARFDYCDSARSQAIVHVADHVRLVGIAKVRKYADANRGIVGNRLLARAIEGVAIEHRSLPYATARHAEFPDDVLRLGHHLGCQVESVDLPVGLDQMPQHGSGTATRVEQALRPRPIHQRGDERKVDRRISGVGAIVVMVVTVPPGRIAALDRCLDGYMTRFCCVSHTDSNVANPRRVYLLLGSRNRSQHINEKPARAINNA